jgi:hypothetical protein
MVRQKFLDRVLDQCLNRHAAQDGSELELPVLRLGNLKVSAMSSPGVLLCPDLGSSVNGGWCVEE